MPSRLALCPRGLGFTLVAHATHSRLALRTRGSRYALAACTTPLRLGFALAGHATCSRLGLRRRRWWRQRQWKRRQQMLALAAHATRLQAWALPSWLGFARFALAAHATRSRLGFAQTQQSNIKAAAAKAALAALPPICQSGSGWRHQRWLLRWHRLQQRRRQHQRQQQWRRWWWQQQWWAVAAAAEVAAVIAAAARAAAAVAGRGSNVTKFW